MGNTTGDMCERVPYKSTYPFAIVLHGIFSPEECQQLIDRSEQEGYEQAALNVGGGQQEMRTDIRNSSRCIIDDAELAGLIWERVKDRVPATWGEGEWAVEEVNERLRFLRYDEGEFFAPHMDGSYTRPRDHEKAGDRSMVTLQLYLNEGFEGGSTRFFGQMKGGRSEFDVVPKTGSVLLFEHRLTHSGEALVAGRKYAIRTDIMYTLRNK